MRHHLAAISIILTTFATACGDDDPEPFECSLGQLTGIWRSHYVETNGTCGPIPDETAVVGQEMAENCSIDLRGVSEDKCRMEVSTTCLSTTSLISYLTDSEEPLLDTRSTWMTVLEQVQETKVSGTGMLEFAAPDLFCRSTYTITVTQL